MTNKPIVPSEADGMTALDDLLRRFGWRFFHIEPSQRPDGSWASCQNPEGEGFPDRICIRGLRLIVIEGKTDKSQLAPKQRDWILDFIGVGAEAYIHRPSDDIKKLVEILR